MIQHIVGYLHDARVPFRLTSYPSEEHEPKVAYPIPKGGMLVDTDLVLVEGRTVLVCYPRGETPDLAAVGSALGGIAVAGTTADLPDEFRSVELPIPPLGQLFGMPLVVDERVRECSMLVFRAFGDEDYFEIPYEDYGRLEQPRLASFASAGELAPAPDDARAALH